MRTPFLGGHSPARSQNLSYNRAINLFPELVDSKDGKDIGALFMCPGLDLFAAVGSGPIRGLHVVFNSGNPILYAVSGNGAYSITPTLGATKLGNLTTTTGPVSMIDNGSQVAIFDSANAYMITVSSGAFAQLSVPFSVPVTAIEQDGFGVVAQANSNQWFQSNLNDLSTWNSLNFATSQAKPDSVIALADIHREIFVLKQTNFEVWVNVGNAGFTFQRVDGVFPEIGCVASFSVAKAGESLLWLSQNDQGQGIVVKADGYTPRRVSTHAIEYQIAQLSTIADAIAYVHQQEGHVFYVLTFPTGNLTLAYDLSTGLWHQRGAFSSGAFGRHWSNCGAFFNGKYVVGDFQNGNIYAYNMATHTDNGTQRVWLRSWRALPKPVDKPIRFDSLRIDMETGAGVAATDNPQVMLRWSDDGGHVWSNQRIQPAGKAGQTAQRVKFNRLGSTRRNSGLDRIFELSSADAFNVALISAELEAS